MAFVKVRGIESVASFFTRVAIGYHRSPLVATPMPPLLLCVKKDVLKHGCVVAVQKVVYLKGIFETNFNSIL